MSDPSKNRRSGVDAGILQGEFLRGYDVSNAGEDPDDLLISPGKSSFDGAVAEVSFWNRTDELRPVFSLIPGLDPNTTPKLRVFAGTLSDPNGTLSAEEGSLYISNNPSALWQNQSGTDVWKKISDDLGGENLAETLLIGNSSGSTDIQMSKIPGPTLAARVRGEDTNDGTDGGPLILSGGSSSSLLGGNGGGVVVTSGSSIIGMTGPFLAGSLNSTSGSTGTTTVVSGTTTSGDSGNVILSSGNASRDTGSLTLATGNSTGTNPGDISIVGGSGPFSGAGVSLFSGSPTGGNNPGGPFLAFAGTGSGLGAGGSATIRAGNGGPGGGVGGSVFITAGNGGGGGSDGLIVGTGKFSTDNYLYGNGDPNSLGISADEGSLFQRTTPGKGEAWINTNGSPLGWQRLAFAADFINSFSRLCYGFVSPALDNPGAAVDDFSDILLYEGVQPHSAGGTQSRTLDSIGPVISFSTANLNDEAGWSIPSNTSGIRREHRFLAVFKLSNTTTVSNQRISIGLSSTIIGVQLSSDEPGGQYVTLTKKDGSASWVFLTRGPGGPQSQTLEVISSSVNAVRYAVFDFTDDSQCKFQLLDESFGLIAEKSANGLFIPTLTTNLYPVFGVKQTDVSPVGLKFYQASVITEADLILSGGAAFANQTLAQVLTVGNETGGTNISVTHGDFILGETDGNGINGGDLTLFSGATTAGITGIVRVASSPNSNVASPNGTGAMIFQSGDIPELTNTGNTGSVFLSSGTSLGSGNSGNVHITTGVSANGGSSGELKLSTNMDLSSNCTPGRILIQGGSTTKGGASGGEVTISTGNANNPSGGDGGELTLMTGMGDSLANSNGGNIIIETGPGNNSGASGNVTISSGNGGSSGNAGSIEIVVGDSNLANGSNLTLRSGDGVNSGGLNKGGDIIFETGVADVPGFFLFNGIFEKNTQAFKFGVISLDGLITDGNGFLSLSWGVGPLASYSPFSPGGNGTASFVEFYDPSFFLSVKVTTTLTASLDLRFYDSTGTPVNALVFGAGSSLKFMTILSR